MQDDIDTSVLDYLKSLTLLCVEDNKTTQLIYNSIFEDLVGEIIFAYNGEEGYKNFIHRNINIIISDYDMPILNGLDMIEKIRQTDKDIPIILVTAIQEIDVIVKALQLNVNNFLKKPIKSKEVMHAIENVSKILIADNYLREKREKRIKELQDKHDYNSYQEDLAFSKELSILKNDFYYQLINMKCTALIDFMYKPLDILSGDAYSARRVDGNQVFCIVVDGMGKGLSASLSAMLITSFINHIIDTSEFDLNRVIYDSIEYIKPILLEEEALSLDYILLDFKKNIMSYAKFSMPASLIQTDNNEIISVKSNNPPISKYIKEFKISTFDTSNSMKFLFYSDGVIENSTRFKDKLYSEFIQEDFLNSFTKEDLKEKLLWKIGKQEDDITFIFIHKLEQKEELKDNLIAVKNFSTTMKEVDNANEWYADIWENLTDNTTLKYTAEIVFSEFFMNAFEHGNLDISIENKHKLLEDNIYFETLAKLEKESNKQITVSIKKIKYNSCEYIITKIEDEGSGFDTQILSKIFRNIKSFNGRGVFVSRQYSDGIYYNQKGNSVIFLHKIVSEA